ncbi:MAG: hypothetical protein ACE5IY_10935 [bacterium]
MEAKTLPGIVSVLIFSLLITASYAQDLHVNPAVNNCSIELDPSLTQSQFRKFIKQGSLIGSLKLLSPAEPLGSRRFEIGIEYSRSPIDDKDPAWNNTFTHPHENHYLGNAITVPISLTKDIFLTRWSIMKRSAFRRILKSS